MQVDIVGEDLVTQAIIERLLNDYRPDITIKSRLPARGGQIKSFAPKYNKLNAPVILLTDLDTYTCPPLLISDWFGADQINHKFLFRIAQEEAETWLMADREGFAYWIGVDAGIIPLPTIIDTKKSIQEIICPYKPSLYMMREVASQSNKIKLKEDLTPRLGAKKGPGYNSALLPFINTNWNIQNAAINSFSLNKAITRLKNYQP